MEPVEPLASIVIPCFNYGRFLGDAIDSALAQTHRHVEVLVIDDGSDDETPSIAQRFGDRIEFLRQSNRGLPETRNIALDIIRGEYVVFLDADNALEPEFVKATLAAFRAAQDPHLAFVFTQMAYFGLEEFVTTLPDFDLGRLKRWNYIDACALVRTDVAKRVRYSREPYRGFEDWDFWLSLAEKGFIGQLVDEPLVRFRKHGSSMLDEIGLNGELQRAIRHRTTLRHWRLYGPRPMLGALAGKLRPSTRQAIAKAARPRSDI